MCIVMRTLRWDRWGGRGVNNEVSSSTAHRGNSRPLLASRNISLSQRLLYLKVLLREDDDDEPQLMGREGPGSFKV